MPLDGTWLVEIEFESGRIVERRMPGRLALEFCHWLVGISSPLVFVDADGKQWPAARRLKAAF